MLDDVAIGVQVDPLTVALRHKCQAKGEEKGPEARANDPYTRYTSNVNIYNDNNGDKNRILPITDVILNTL